MTDAKSLLAKFQSEREELTAEIEALSSRITEAKHRLKEVAVIASALEVSVGGGTSPTAAPKKTAAKKTAPKKTAPKKTAPKKTAPKKTAPKKTAAKSHEGGSNAAAKPARKGRRKADKTGVHALGIVDAAVYLAKEKGIKEADAGDVLGWFEEVGYKTRGSLPNRNSVYVSLNREFRQGEKDGTQAKVTRVGRGSFVFHS